MDYKRFLTPKSLSRTPSAIRDLQKYLGIPGMISLGGGSPNPSTFPLAGLSLTLKTGEAISVTEKELESALQYSNTAGLPPLVRILRDIQIRQHGRLDTSFDLLMSTGSQDAFEMFLEPLDTLLVESPTYTGALNFLRPHGCKFVQIDVDKDGIIASHLGEILDTWADPSTKPKILYTIPNGGNPTGISTSEERKCQVYAIAQKHNILIMEDDPYYYLQFKARTKSYFSMDCDQRVLRFDSISKIISSGLRIGWATGPKPLLERLILHTQATSLHTSGMSQLVVLKILQAWGYDGFIQHCDQVSDFYKRKRDVFLNSASKHLNGLAHFETPDAGMFVWLKLLGVKDTMALVKEKAVERKLLFEFHGNPQLSPHIRASFSTATDQEIDIALERLARLIEENQSINKDVL